MVSTPRTASGVLVEKRGSLSAACCKASFCSSASVTDTMDWRWKGELAELTRDSGEARAALGVRIPASCSVERDGALASAASRTE